MSMHTERTPRECKSGDHTDASTRKGMLRLSVNQQKWEEKHSGFLLIFLRESQTFQYIDLGHLAVRTMR